LDWLGKVLRFLAGAGAREFKTEAGRANVIFVVLLTVGLLAFGYLDALRSAITSIWGADSSGFPPVWAFGGDLVLMIFCVTILFAAERSKRR
jgi:hypothetical protein